MSGPALPAEPSPAELMVLVDDCIRRVRSIALLTDMILGDPEAEPAPIEAAVLEAASSLSEQTIERLGVVSAGIDRADLAGRDPRPDAPC